jgi:anti-anti-sigma factor
MEDPEKFSVSVGVREGFRVLVVRGELNEATVLRLQQLMNAKDGRPVIVDLTPLAFISSVGIHLLLRESGIPAALVCPPGSIARVFEIVGAARRLPIFDKLDHAVQSLTLSQSA